MPLFRPCNSIVLWKSHKKCIDCSHPNLITDGFAIHLGEPKMKAVQNLTISQDSQGYFANTKTFVTPKNICFSPFFLPSYSQFNVLPCVTFVHRIRFYSSAFLCYLLLYTHVFCVGICSFVVIQSLSLRSALSLPAVSFIYYTVV